MIFFAFDYNRKSSWRKSFTFIQRANFSLAPGKSPACRRANPAAPHTPEGSRPHLVETSIARDSRSASINLSRRRLQQIYENNYQIKKSFSLCSSHILWLQNLWNLIKETKLLIVILASSITPTLPPPSLGGFYFRVIMTWTLSPSHRTLQSQGAWDHEVKGYLHSSIPLETSSDPHDQGTYINEMKMKKHLVNSKTVSALAWRPLQLITCRRDTRAENRWIPCYWIAPTELTLTTNTSI